MQVVPLGKSQGVGVVFGYEISSFMVKIAKSKDFMIGNAPKLFQGTGNWFFVKSSHSPSAHSRGTQDFFVGFDIMVDIVMQRGWMKSLRIILPFEYYVSSSVVTHSYAAYDRVL